MKPTWRVNMAPPTAAMRGGEAKHENLEIRDVIAGEPDAFLFVADRNQNTSEFARGHEARQQHRSEQ